MIVSTTHLWVYHLTILIFHFHDIFINAPLHCASHLKNSTKADGRKCRYMVTRRNGRAKLWKSFAKRDWLFILKYILTTKSHALIPRPFVIKKIEKYFCCATSWNIYCPTVSNFIFCFFATILLESCSNFWHLSTWDVLDQSYRTTISVFFKDRTESQVIIQYQQYPFQTQNTKLFFLRIFNTQQEW